MHFWMRSFRSAKRFVCALAAAASFVILNSAAIAASPEAGPRQTGVIVGQITMKGGGPLAGGMVFLFDKASGPPPSATRYWRVPSYAFPLDDNGRFSAELPEGTYYLGSFRRHAQQEPYGPPQDGDVFFISQDDKGMPVPHTIKKGELVDIGVVREALPFNRSMLAKEGLTSLEGTVTDAEGKPVEGALVFGFINQSMIGRPHFVSDVTGKDGKYLLRVAEGGTYYLRVRSHFGGGPPVEGEIMGVYGERSGVTLKTGEAKKGIDVKIMKFPGRGQMRGMTQEKKNLRPDENFGKPQ